MDRVHNTAQHEDIDQALATVIDPYSGWVNMETLRNTDMKIMGLWSCDIDDPHP
jgi:hypothetical protein